MPTKSRTKTTASAMSPPQGELSCARIGSEPRGLFISSYMVILHAAMIRELTMLVAVPTAALQQHKRRNMLVKEFDRGLGYSGAHGFRKGSARKLDLAQLTDFGARARMRARY